MELKKDIIHKTKTGTKIWKARKAYQFLKKEVELEYKEIIELTANNHENDCEYFHFKTTRKFNTHLGVEAFRTYMVGVYYNSKNELNVFRVRFDNRTV